MSEYRKKILELKSELTSRFDIETANIIAKDAGLEFSEIEQSNKRGAHWHNIIERAEVENKITVLVVDANKKVDKVPALTALEEIDWDKLKKKSGDIDLIASRPKSQSMESQVNIVARIAFCSMVALLGAAIVSQSKDLGGFVWWFLLLTLLGTLIEDKGNSSKYAQLYGPLIVGSFFLISTIGIYLVFGVGPSGYIPNGAASGVDFQKIPERIDVFSTFPLYWVFLGFGVLTCLGIYLASLASELTKELIVRARGISMENYEAFDKKFNIIVAVVVTIIGFITHIIELLIN